MEWGVMPTSPLLTLDLALKCTVLMHFALYHLQAFEKGFKPKGSIFPCGYEVHANVDETMAERLKDLAKVMGKSGNYKLCHRTFSLWQWGSRDSAMVRAFASASNFYSTCSVFDSQS